MPQKPLVLVVEDELLIALATADFLQERGLAVITAGSLTEALNVLHDPTVTFAALFLDVRFKDGTTSHSLARAARVRFPGIPVLYASGMAAAADEGERVSGSRFVGKPYRIDHVAEILHEMIGASR